MRRRWFFLAAGALFVLGLWVLGARPGDLVPNEGGRKLAADFFSAALRPAMDYEAASPGLERVGFLEKVARSLGLTVRYAAVAMSLALMLGIILGVLGSRAWWSHSSRALRALRLSARLLATALRSVHEVMWALLFLAAVGTSPLAAIIALAIPYGGTLAKVFSELLDEADSSTAEVMKASGASGWAAFLAITARALPDLITYTLYRLECAVRSSAVLGFVGVPTLGYEIATAFEDGHYREIWTYLYALLLVVVLFEWWSTWARRVLTKGLAGKAHNASLPSQWRARGRSTGLRLSLLTVVGLTLAGWFAEERWGATLGFERRMQNLSRFLGELVPHPVRESGHWGEFFPWLSKHLTGDGTEAIWRTFHLGTTATLLAGAVAILGILIGARSLATGSPRGITLGNGHVRQMLGLFTRAASIATRGMPEFILAFLLLQIFGPTMWALIFAIAIHNGGILLRLGAEVIDNTPGRQAEILLSSGAHRSAVFLTSLIPESLNRLILFLFYRWESGIREATILGMLGVGSLGALIAEARAGLFYDEMLLWVILGGGLVFLGDLTSDAVRRRLESSSS